MKFVQIERYGIDELKVSEKDAPRPGAGEVLVRIKANSLNFRDLRVVQGLYDPKMALPRIPLSDGAGEVTEVGAGVTRWKAGDRVAGIFMQTWLAGPVEASHSASALGGAIDGMLAEYVALREDGLVRIPDGLSYEEAATLPCAPVTAWNALMCQSRVKPGDTVLIQGTGGVSIIALDFALMAGARVIVTSSSDEKLERAMARGASDGINYKTTPQWAKKVRDLTGGRGVDHIVEVGGAGTFTQSLQAVRVGGHINMIGILAGVAAEVTTGLILAKSVQIHGIYVGSREMFEDMNRAIEQHALKPVIDRIFGMGEVREAFHHLEGAGHFGKIVIGRD